KNRSYAASIINKLTAQHKHGLIAEIRDRGQAEMADRIREIVEYLVNDAIKGRRYTSSVLPTIVSPQLAPNFWFKNEKKPTREEVYRLLHLILTGLYRGSYVVNLDNAKPTLREDFRKSLIQENILIFPEGGVGGGVNIKKIFTQLNLARFPVVEFGFTLLILSCFVKWLKNKVEKPEFLKRVEEMGLPQIISDIGVDDSLSLVFFNIPRQKKEMHIFPRLKDFIARWYHDFLTGAEDIDLLLFLSSLYIVDENFKEISDAVMNKFIYYLLRGHINGELLVDMINIKIKHELEERRRGIYPIQRVREILRRI
ncbi:MAG: hypothetical protein QXY01_07465, partial [Candidatus Bathyarchaeia archaeon]